MRTSKIITLLTLASLLMLTASCKRKLKEGAWTDTITTGIVPVAVDDSFEPIFETQVDVFETIYKGAGIIPIYTNEVDALQLLFDDSVRLAIVSRKLTPNEILTYKEKSRYPKAIHIATDAIALITHKDNPDTLISIHTLKKILTGKITRWSELNPNTHLKGEINVVFDNKRSGILRYIVDSVCNGEPLSANVFAQKENKEVVDYVSQSPHAMGLIGVNWVENESDTTRLSFHQRVNVMAVSKLEYANEDNSYKPFQAYIALRYYPLVREVYAILNDAKAGLSTGLTSFLTSQRGQYIIMKSGLIPATQQIRLVEINTN